MKLYYIDFNDNVLVRYIDGTLEMLSKAWGEAMDWMPIDYDSPYAREIFLGGGNDCLCELNEEAAFSWIQKWTSHL